MTGAVNRNGLIYQLTLSKDNYGCSVGHRQFGAGWNSSRDADHDHETQTSHTHTHTQAHTEL